ncbi:hypothetical protein [Mucilaginibacter sp.]|uniref:hypothetical protein n=1 Tax=Mucilaginibacter sp. TaxID=1882438 RepID=UPI002637C5F7|nr:hypothetical protein [Mucilaginibacter sp.]MDB4919834.1 hypothetical protein [Mucilaginibacter sp.]
MKANELRIGNIVKSNKGSFVIVKEINEGSFNGTVRVVDTTHYDDEVLFGYSCSEIEPIKLTPEIFLKCGFKQIGVCEFGYSYRLKLNSRMEFAWYPGEEILRVQTTSSGSTTSLRHIEALHQFQNLFFAYTGDELTITL